VQISGGIHFQSQGTTRKHEIGKVTKKNIIAVNKLNVLYMNADSFLNKRLEFKNLVSEQAQKLDFTGIVVVKAKKLAPYGTDGRLFRADVSGNFSLVTQKSKPNIKNPTPIKFRYCALV